MHLNSLEASLYLFVLTASVFISYLMDFEETSLVIFAEVCALLFLRSLSITIQIKSFNLAYFCLRFCLFELNFVRAVSVNHVHFHLYALIWDLFTRS